MVSAVLRKNAVPTKKPRVVFYLDAELEEKLKRLAKAKKRSLSNLMEVIAIEVVEKAEKDGEI